MATTIVITPPPADPVTVGVTPPAPTTTTIVLNETIPAGVPTGGTTGQVLAKTSGADYATAWVDQTGGGGGATNLTFTRGGTTVTVESSTGTDAVLPAATTSLAGVLSAADKTKLDGIATGATANSPDATLLARANHTGTQAASTITGLATVATSGAYSDLSGAPSSLPPSGGAGGVLSGTYPNPGFAVDMATQAELDSGLAGKANTSHTHGNITNAGAIGGSANLPVITGASGVLTTGTFGTAANSFCQGNDARLSDARTPTAHTHGNITNVGAIGSTENLPVITGASGVLSTGTFGTTANTFCQGNDARLSDARTPLSHTHGNITNAGAIGSTANLPVITGASGVLATGTFGSTANTFCQGNDARLSDARTPTAHTHVAADITDFSSASRAQTEAALVAGANITITPAGSGATRTLTIAAAGGGAGTNLTYDAATRVIASDTGTDATLPLMSSGNAGLVPASGGGTTNFLRADGTFAAPPGGGGGSPGGTTGEIQFNNAGAFGGAANLEVEGGNLRLVAVASEPSAPAAGGLLMYSRSVAGRVMPKVIGPSGMGTTLQESFCGNKIFVVSMSSGSNEPTVFGGTITTAITRSLEQTVGSTNLWTSSTRKRFTTNTTAGNATGMRTSYGQWFRGSAAGFGGWFFRTQFGAGTNLNASHCFVGLCQQISVLSNEPSLLTNMIGMGHDSTDATTGNWFLMHNNGSGTATKIDLGTNAARNTTDGYDLVIFCPPGVTSQIFVRVVNIRTGVTVYDSSVNTNLPAVDLAIAFKGETRTGAAGASAAIDFGIVYISSDY